MCDTAVETTAGGLTTGWWAVVWECFSSQTVYNTKGARAHTHRELIREWLWEPKGSSGLEYISMFVTSFVVPLVRASSDICVHFFFLQGAIFEFGLHRSPAQYMNTRLSRPLRPGWRLEMSAPSDMYVLCISLQGAIFEFGARQSSAQSMNSHRMSRPPRPGGQLGMHASSNMSVPCIPLQGTIFEFGARRSSAHIMNSMNSHRMSRPRGLPTRGCPPLLIFAFYCSPYRALYSNSGHGEHPHSLGAVIACRGRRGRAGWRREAPSRASLPFRDCTRCL